MGVVELTCSIDVPPSNNAVDYVCYCDFTRNFRRDAIYRQTSYMLTTVAVLSKANDENFTRRSPPILSKQARNNDGPSESAAVKKGEKIYGEMLMRPKKNKVSTELDKEWRVVIREDKTPYRPFGEDEVIESLLKHVQEHFGIEDQMFWMFWYSKAHYEHQGIMSFTYENYYNPMAHMIIAHVNSREAHELNHEGHWSDVVFPTWIKSCQKEVKLDETLKEDGLIRGLRYIVRAKTTNYKTIKLIDEFMPEAEQQSQTFTPTERKDGFYGTSQAACNEE